MPVSLNRSASAAHDFFPKAGNLVAEFDAQIELIGCVDRIGSSGLPRHGSLLATLHAKKWSAIILCWAIWINSHDYRQLRKGILRRERRMAG
jgi:hypothetical protein